MDAGSQSVFVSTQQINGCNGLCRLTWPGGSKSEADCWVSQTADKQQAEEDTPAQTLSFSLSTLTLLLRPQVLSESFYKHSYLLMWQTLLT